MSRSLNKVTLIGNLGADPEVRSTQNGGRVATLSVATSRQWKGQDGQMQEKTEWHRVIFWNSNYSKLADIAEKYCRKGEKIYVEGSIEYRSWQDKEGQTRYTTEIRGNELILLGGRGGQGAESFAPAKAAAGASAGGCQGQGGVVRRLPGCARQRRRRPPVLRQDAQTSCMTLRRPHPPGAQPALVHRGKSFIVNVLWRPVPGCNPWR